MTINIAMVDVTVSKPDHDFNERERNILEVLLLNLAAHANSYATKGNMVFTPIEKKDDTIFSFQFAWQKSILKEQYDEFVSSVHRKYETAFNMCDIENIEIHFLENVYLKK